MTDDVRDLVAQAVLKPDTEPPVADLVRRARRRRRRRHASLGLTGLLLVGVVAATVAGLGVTRVDLAPAGPSPQPAGTAQSPKGDHVRASVRASAFSAAEGLTCVEFHIEGPTTGGVSRGGTACFDPQYAEAQVATYSAKNGTTVLYGLIVGSSDSGVDVTVTFGDDQRVATTTDEQGVFVAAGEGAPVEVEYTSPRTGERASVQPSPTASRP